MALARINIPRRKAVEYVSIALPAQTGSLTYNGSSQTPSWANYDSTQISMTGETSATNAGTHTVYCTPIGNYCWADGTQDTKPVTWTMAKATGSVTLSANSGTVTYGESATFSATGTGTLSVSSAATGYATASLSGNTVTVECVAYRSSPVTITVTSAATTNYTAASATYTMTPAQATATISLSATSATLNASTTSKNITVTTNSDGTVSATSSDTSACTVAVSGKIVTVSGNKKGSATVTIKVSGGNYTTVTATVAVTVSANVPANMLNGRTLAQVQQIFRNGQGAEYFKVGDYFDITMASAVTLDSGSIASGSKWRVVLIGIDHNSSIEGTNRGHFCIGRTTGNTEISFFGHMAEATNTNVGWSSCDMRTFLNGTFYNALPSDLRSVIVACTKYTTNVGKSGEESAVTATSDKIWLMAEFEVWGKRKCANQYEQNKQQQYSYYKSGASKLRYKHTATSTAGNWWERSPSYFFASNGQLKANYYCVTNTTPALTYYYPNSKYGLAPCFCIG